MGQYHIRTAEAGVCTAGSTVTSVSCEQRPRPFPVRISIRTLRESVPHEIAADLKSLPMFREKAHWAYPPEVIANVLGDVIDFK